MSDDLLAELKMMKEETAPKNTVDLSDPKFGGEVPNFQSYWKVFAEQLQPVEGYDKFRSAKTGEEYTLRMLPWKHGKYMTNIPLDVKKDANGKYVSMQSKDLKKGEVAKIKTHLISHFQKCLENGTLPIDLAHFIVVNNYIDPERGMLMFRADLTNTIKELIPKEPEPMVVETPERVTPKEPEPVVTSESSLELYEFINQFTKKYSINADTLLNSVGMAEYERQRDEAEVLSVEEKALVEQIKRNKRHLSMETLKRHLPAKIARRCN